MHATFSPINVNAITKRNLLAYFRKQRSKAEALRRFDCTREVQGQVIQSERHVERFDAIFHSLIKKGMIAVRNHNRYQTVKGNDRTVEPSGDDAEATL